MSDYRCSSDLTSAARYVLAVAVALVGFHACVHTALADDAVDATLPKVVKIFGAGGLRGLEAYGTGFLISPEGHIATVWSHVLDTDEVSVVLHDGHRYPAKVLGAEPNIDIAVIQIQSDRTDFPHFDVNAGASAGPGARVLGFSNMYRIATGDEPVSVMHGVIMARTELKARRGRYEVPFEDPVYLIDAITNNPGAAGGVLTTRDGRLLGMIGRELRNAESNTWINYAMPIDAIAKDLTAIQTGDFSSSSDPLASDGTPTDGPKPLDLGIVLVPDVLVRTPAYVDDLLTDSVAEQAGLQPDDLIVFLNGELVQSVALLNRELSRLQELDDVTLIIRRGETLETVTMRVPRRDE